MSQDKQTEQEALRVQEPETERLLPAWLLTLIYAVGVPWCVGTVVYIAYAGMVQGRVVEAVRVVSGRAMEVPLALSDPRAEQAVEILSESPKQGFLYVLEELQRREIKNRRMARVTALRKALGWTRDSARRALLAEVLQHMSPEGEVEEGYVLPEQHARVLEELIAERKEAASESYAEQKITEVLEWLAGGHATPPKGPEYRRVKSLQVKYEKRKFQGPEVSALEEIMEQWRQQRAKAYQQAAAEFEKMLDEQPASLSPEARRLCEEHIRQWEGEFLKGRENLAEVAHILLKRIIDRGMHLDHPPVYVIVKLLEHRHKPVQDRMADCVMLLKESRFTIEYLANFAAESTVNPVLAVETETMTKEEHEALLAEENTRRRRKAIELLTDIALDWCQKRAQTGDENPYGLDVADPRAFFKDHVVEMFREISAQKEVRDLARESMAKLRAACPDYFD